jgi:hypothetical protein
MEPNADHIYRHLQLLFSRAAKEYGGQIELGAIVPDGGYTSFRTPCDEAGFEAATEWALRQNRMGKNVYVGKNPRNNGWPEGKSGTDDDVDIAFNIVADLDKPEAAEVIRKKDLPLMYRYVVRTGTEPNLRGHIYYDLDEPMRNMNSYCRIQEIVAQRVKGDNIPDPRRIVRLAGTVSYPDKKKRDENYKTELTYLKTYLDGRDPVSPEELRIAFHGNAEPNPPSFDDPIPDLSPTHVQGAKANGGGLGLVSPRVKDPDEAVEARISANDNWDNAVTKMVARLMADGLSADEVVDKAVAEYTADGYTVEQTRREVSAKVRRVLKKYETGQWVKPDLKVVPAEEDAIVDLGIRPVGLLQPMLRKKREYLVPQRFMRGHVTLTSAAPGVGKSTLAIQEAVALVSGHDFLGFEVEPMRVAIINNEESGDEIERRIEATCQCFEVPLESIAENLFIRSGVDAAKFVIAKDVGGQIMATPHHAALKKLVQDLKLDLLVIDPFVQTHFVTESSNEAISQVMVLLRDSVVGDEHSAALNLVHHIRKPPGGLRASADDMMVARGASSMLGEAHFVFNLSDMSKRDAEEVGIDEDDRRSYLRLDDAKTKMGPPGDAVWFERHGEDMVRKFDTEEVGVLVPWVPDTTVGMATQTQKRQLLEYIDGQHGLGKPLTSRGKRDIKSLATKKFKLRRKMVRDLVRDWKRDGVIETVRVTKGGQKLRGVGLTVKGRKLLKSYGPEADLKDPKRNNGPEWTRTDPKRGVLDPKRGVLDPKWPYLDPKQGPQIPPHTPPAKGLAGRGSAFRKKSNSGLRTNIDD